MTGEPSLDSQYFTQTLLPGYIAAYPEAEAWDVTYDARGHFAEPHTRIVTPLGTLDVRRYLNEVAAHKVARLSAAEFELDGRFPTCGPEHRFSALLFIEKEGFLPLFAAVKLAERYDIALMSTKGMPVVACRRLADELCGRYDIPLLVLHDFDKAGFSIVGTLDGRERYDPNTLADRPNRYEYENEIQVFDLGLRLKDVRDYRLESEPVVYRKNSPADNLAQNGATRDEIEFLCGSTWPRRSGHRVELNAFASDVFVAWIEKKLVQHGIAKVIPSIETLEIAYRRAAQIGLVHARLPTVYEEAGAEVAQMKIPKSLQQAVAERLQADRTIPWDRAVSDLAKEGLA
jgi:hypothetical protein